MLYSHNKGNSTFKSRQITRTAVAHREELKKQQLNDMLNQKIIRASLSQWKSPLWVAPKKRDARGKQKWRLVIDYRRLNVKTTDDKYPLPKIEEIQDNLGSVMYFSALGLTNRFHQVKMCKCSIPKTIFFSLLD